MGSRRLRALPLLALVAVVGILVLPATATSSPNRRSVALSSLETGVLQQLNAIRAQHHLVPLTLSVPLTVASKQHTTEMGQDGYFEHSSHDGTAFWKRISRWYSTGRLPYLVGRREPALVVAQRRSCACHGSLDALTGASGQHPFAALA